VNDPDFYPPHYWIEGVGSSKELFSTYNGQYEDQVYTLCFKPDSINTYYISSPDENNWCYYYVGTNNLELQSLRIYPNPATDIIYLKSELNHYSEFQISDVTGKLLLNGKIEKDKPISIMDLKSGFYLITFTSKQTAFQVKFIKL